MSDTENISKKSGKFALFLSIFLGAFGFHRFYLGKIFTGILMLVTFGFFGIWVFVDMCFLLCNKMEDGKGNRVVVLNKVHPAFVLVPLFALWFVMFIGLIVGGVFYFTSGMVEVVKTQVSALESGNIDAAYSYTSPAFKHATSKDNFEEFVVNSCPSLTSKEDSFISSRKIENHYGYVYMERTSDANVRTGVSFNLIKNNENWLIQGINCQPIK